MAWPLDLPARDALGQAVAAWAEFDAAWYLNAYPEAARQCRPGDPAGPLAYYLEHGQQAGHSPNRFFDEQWHRRAYKPIADRVAAGDYASAFDAYCRGGSLDRSAHWLFNELDYRDRYPDLTDGVLQAAELANGYDHYLRHGTRDGRIGHRLFDPAAYLANFDPQDVPAIRAAGVFAHYLARIETDAPELPTSACFDPAWYLRRYPEVAAAIKAGEWKCALHHYLCNGQATAFDPSPHFSETFYLSRDPGLLAFIEQGHFRNGYDHFLRFGAREKRPPSAQIDLAWYAAQPEVAAELDGTDAFAHWLAIGLPGGGPLAYRPSDAEPSPAQAALLRQRAATARLPFAGRFGYGFVCKGPPAVSVVMAVRDGFAATLAAIEALRASSAEDIELILADCGSADETRAIGRYVPGAKVLRFDSDIGWSQAAEAGRTLASAPCVLFLSPKLRLAFNAIGRALARLGTQPAVGAVGGMILAPTGLIAHAGGILWNDGDAHDYQSGASPLAPEANFVRDVDFVSPLCLLVRAEALDRIGGLDGDCAPGYEAIDLCLRIAGADLRVVYDPSVQGILDSDPPPRSGPCPHFRSKHEGLLARRPAPSGAGQAFARHAGPLPHRVLFLDDALPVRRTGSGFVRSNDIVRAMADLGCAVTVYPVNGSACDLALAYADMPDTAEVMHDRAFADFKPFMEARQAYYDTIWVARSHNLDRIRPVLAALRSAGALRADIVLDTEAVAPLRDALRAERDGKAFDLDAALSDLAANASLVRATVAVTAAEAQVLREIGLPLVSVVGHAAEATATPLGFEQRSGMLFVGAIHTADSPNLDSLAWFADQVLPLIERRLGWRTRLTVAGYAAPGIDLGRLARHPRITLLGERADLWPLYDSHRVFVAPTRFAAGAPYKVLEAACHGLPVAATDLLAGQLGWPEACLATAPVDDAAGFADAAVALHEDAALWAGTRAAALRQAELDHDHEGFRVAVARVLSISRPVRVVVQRDVRL